MGASPLEAARDALALVRAHNAGDTEGVAVLLDHADLRAVAGQLVSVLLLALEHGVQLEHGIQPGPASRAYFDAYLARLLAQLNAQLEAAPPHS